MSLILSGTDGLSDVDGTAATPAIRGTDANTGIFFPAADTIAFSEGGAECARFDASGRLGIGTATMSTSENLVVSNGTVDLVMSPGAFSSGNTAMIGTKTNHAIAFAINTAQKMTIDTSGNLGVNQASPSFKIDAIGSTTNGSGIVTTLRLKNGGASANDGAKILFTAGTSTDGAGIGSGGQALDSADLRFYAGGNTERARIDTSGYFKASNSGAYLNGTYHEMLQTGANNIAYFSNTNATAGNNYGINISYRNADPNGTGNHFIYCEGNSSTQRMSVRSNGGIANYSGNNDNLSDRREKANFAPAKSYLDVICAIPVQTFNYIDQNMEDDGGLTLGVVAQDVQAVAPELVMESNWAAEGQDPKMRLSIYQTDLQYALMKCIQEQQAIITTLTARITALESA